MEAAKLKRDSSDLHQQASLKFQAAQKKVKELNKNLKGAILKSRLGITLISLIITNCRVPDVFVTNQLFRYSSYFVQVYNILASIFCILYIRYSKVQS